MASPPDYAPSQSSNTTSSPDSSPPPPSSESPPPPEDKSPPPSSPPPSSPPPSSPPPSSPPPKKNDSLPSPPPSPPASTTPSPEGSASPPPSIPPPSPATTLPSPATPNSTPALPAVFSPPPPVGSEALSPPTASQAYKLPTESSSSTPPSHSSSSSSSSSSDAAIFVGLTLGGVLILAFIIASVICMCRKKKNKKTYYMDAIYGPSKGGQHWNSPPDHIVKLPPPSGGGGWGPPPAQNGSGDYSSGYSGTSHPTPQRRPSANMNLGFSQSQFSYDELASATNGFSQANLLGQGGFGYVHKGVLPNGQEVAVKSLKSGSGQGEREFQAEVEIISRVHHRHLVSLVGYCIANEQRMLVYEFVPNSTLEFHLHAKGRPVMDWGTRLRIAVGSAKGLAYLHEDCHPKIIHRDIKTANILLDNNYEAMVADFGLAKLSSDNYTHVSTRVMGTFGYLAPEYASSGKLTEKSDVFSFGVMLLELITGRKPVDPNSKYMEDSLVDWARPLLAKALEDGNHHEFADPRLEDNFNPQEMARMVAAAAASIRHSARRRPKMSQIVRTLEGDSSSLDDLNEGGAKANQSSAFGTTQSYDTGAYNADMMKFRKMIMETQEYSSEETNEYKHKPSNSDST